LLRRMRARQSERTWRWPWLKFSPLALTGVERERAELVSGTTGVAVPVPLLAGWGWAARRGVRSVAAVSSGVVAGVISALSLR
jgi:hypothetical protein